MAGTTPSMFKYFKQSVRVFMVVCFGSCNSVVVAAEEMVVSWGIVLGVSVEG